MKKCCTCHDEKSLEEFSKNKRSKDGLSSACKSCAKQMAREWRKKNKHDGRVVSNKHCSTCDKVKSANEFYNDKSRVDGLSNQCRKCVQKYRVENRGKLLEAARLQNSKRAEREKIQVDGRVCPQCKEYKEASEYWKSKHTVDGLYSCCKACKKLLEATEHRTATRRNNKQAWRNNNLLHARSYCNTWDKNKRKTDVTYKLRRNVMHAIVASIRNCGYCNGKLERLQKAIFDHLPYTSTELKQHLESQFEPWMSWENHGKYDPNRKTWQIDHIIPQSKLPFDSFRHENFNKLWALENLRPLETIANIKKSNKTIYCQI